MLVSVRRSARGSRPVVEILMMALEGDAPYRVAVEPWGGEFSVEPGASVNLTFAGQGADPPPMIAMWSSQGRVEVWAERGIDDFTARGPDGAELAAE
jgi:hypothetical protein